MRALTRAEFSHWCSEHGLENLSREWPAYRGAEPYCLSVKTPDKSSRAVAFAHTPFYLGEREAFSGAMVWFRDWGIWNETDEETIMRIVLRLRASLGESRVLIDAPGQIFSNEEFVDARAFWTLPVLWGWDAILFPQGADFFVFNSHDEVTFFVSNSQQRHLRLLDGLKDWGAAEDGWYFK